MKNKLTITLLVASVFAIGGVLWAVGQSWGDAQTDGVRESASTALFTPGRQAFDAGVNTAWQLAPGSTSGWVERYWAAPQRLAGVDVNLDLGSGSQVQFSVLANGVWVAIPGAVITGSHSGHVVLTFPGELPATTRVLLTIQGPDAAAAKVWDVSWKPSTAPTPYAKILPKTVTVSDVKAKDQEVVWDLDGTYTVQTLKVFFWKNNKSVRIDFWNGSAWTQPQLLDSGPVANLWQRFDLVSAVTTQRVRMTFPNADDRPDRIAACEVWGTGWRGTPAQALVVPAPDAAGTSHFTVNGAIQANLLEVSVAGATTAPLTGEWNGTAFSLTPATWVGEDTVYRLTLDASSLRSDAQFLKLTTAAALHSVVMSRTADTGQLDLGWPYTDGQFQNTVAGPGHPVPLVTSKVWNLGGSYQLSRLRVFTGAASPGLFKTLAAGVVTTVTWTTQGQGWWEANLNITADKLSVESPTAMTLDEVQLYGTSLAAPTAPADQDVSTAVKATLDQGTALVSTSQTNQTLSGSVDDSGSLVFLGGVSVPVSAKRFSALATLKDGFQLLTVEVWDKDKKTLQARFVKPVYKTVGMPVVVFDFPYGDLSSQASSLTVTGRVGNGLGLTLSLAGNAVPLDGNQFSRTVNLGEGTQNLVFTLRDNTGRETTRTLSVLRDSTPPATQIATPTAGQYIAASQVTFNVSGGVDNQLWWQFNAEPWEPGLTPVKTKTYTLADGFYTYTVSAQDRAGNTSAPASVSFVIDTTPPAAFAIAANVTGWTSNTRPTLTFATTDATAGVDHYEYSLDGGGFSTISSPFVLPPLADGVRTVFVKAIDKAGNSTLARLDLFIDTSLPPQPTGFFPIPGADNVTLKWMGINDGEGFQTYRLERDPAWTDGVHSVDVQAYGAQSSVDPGLTSGSVYKYRLWSVDRAGNVSAKTDWSSVQVGLAEEPVNPDGPTTVNFNQVSVTLPQDVAPSDITSIQIQEVPVQVLNNQPTNTLVSPIFQFFAVRTNASGETVTDHADFTGDLDVQMRYDPSKIPEGFTTGDLKPFYYDTLWGQWLPVEGALVDLDNHQLSFKTNHFTDFSVQATKESEVTPQQLRDVQFSPFGTNLTHAPVSISPQEGGVSTSFTELVLPGKNGLDLTIKRVFSSGTAQGDATLPDPKKDGSYPWMVGTGWRLNLPTMKWNGSGLWITGLDGVSNSFGQASLVNATGTDGQTKVVTLETHEGSDSVAIVTFQSTPQYTDQYVHVFTQSTVQWYSYSLLKTQLMMKDGREVDFDEQGRVSKIFDATHLNQIAFQYSGNHADTITDSLGRTISFTYAGNNIQTIQVAAGDESYVQPAKYTYNSQNQLTSAMDVGGRTWNYGYGTQTLTSTVHVPGHNDPAPTNTNVTTLTSVSGPGLGYISIAYTVANNSYDDIQDKINFTVTQGRLLGTGITVGTAANTPVRTTTYQYNLVSGGEKQFFVATATVNDGRTKTVSSFASVAKVRQSLSLAPDALKTVLGLTAGTRPQGKEVLSYPTLVTVSTTVGGAELETQTPTWDTDHMRMTGTVTQRLVDTNTQTIRYTFDNWGNTTRASNSTKVGDRESSVVDEYSYYNAGNTDLNLGRTDTALLEPILTNGQHSLVAAHRRTAVGQVPTTPASTQTTIEFTTFAYSILGQVSTKKQLLDAGWTATTYKYSADTGELNEVDTPAQVTTYTNDYTPRNSYTVTTTQKGVNLGEGSPTDLSTVNTFDRLNGTNLTTTDAGLNTTTRTFDALGRTKSIVEPAVAAGLPTTSVTYDDLLLTSTVTSPLGLKTVYSFDPLGRLVDVTKTDSSTSETIQTKLTYDAWDDVLTMSGPVSSLEGVLGTGRTLANAVTTFTYDAKGRVTSTRAPGAVNPKRSVYDDTQNLVSMTDEVGNHSSQTLGWDGKPLVQTVSTGGATSEDLSTSTYYDGAGRVIATVDPSGNVTTHQFNSLGLETKTTAPARDVLEGNNTVAGAYPVTNRSYNSAGFLTQISQPLNDAAYQSTATNVLAGAKFRVTKYTPNGLGQVLTTKTDVKVGSATKTIVVNDVYFAVGTKKSETSGYTTDAVKSQKSWTYDSHGKVLTETNENQKITTYTYDLAGNRASVTDPRRGLYTGNFSLGLTYNQFSRLITATLPSLDGSSPTIGFTYDGRGDLVKRVEPDGQTTNSTYSLRGLVLTETLTDGVTSYTTTHDYDDAGREVKVTSPSGHAVLKKYDGAGRVVETDQNTANQMSSVIVYDRNGNKKSVTDGNNHTTGYTYTPEGQVLTVTDAKQNLTTTSYDRLGEPVKTVDPALNTRTYTYDELGRLIAETTPWGGNISTGYDAWGNATSQTDAAGTSFTRTFSPSKQLLTETASVGGKSLDREFTYDEGGDMKTATDNGLVTTYNGAGAAYQPDPFGLIRSKLETVAGQDLLMGYSYDNRQRLSNVSYPGSTSVGYEYNKLGQITGMDGWITDNSLHYDSAGRLDHYTLANGVTKTVGYDSQDRVNNLSYATTTDLLKAYNFTYDQVGNILSKNANSYSYDELNQLTNATELGWFQKQPEDVQNSASYGIVDRDYEGTQGNVQTGTKVLSFMVNSTPIQRTDTIKLDTASRSVGVNLGTSYGVNQIQITPISKDPANRVRQKDLSVFVSPTNNPGSYVRVDGWTYSKSAVDGSITIKFASIVQTQFIKVNTVWDDRNNKDVSVDKAQVYNQAKELIKVWTLRTSRTEADSYDSTGNRTSQSVDGAATQTYTYYKNSAGGDLAWLAADGNWFYQYDGNGNLITKAKNAMVNYSTRAFTLDASKEYWRYSWDLKNRLTAVSKNDVQIVAYQYDADNLRVARNKTGAETTVYAYGRSGAIAYQKNLATGVARTYAYLNDQTIGWIDTATNGTKTSYFGTTDQLGSVTQVTNASAQVVWSSEYNPFGKTAGVEGLYDFDGTYAGHQVDNDTGLIYMWNRWQDPETGRFVSEDPKRDGANFYSYVGNSVENRTDPTGLEVKVVDAPYTDAPDKSNPEEVPHDYQIYSVEKNRELAVKLISEATGSEILIDKDGVLTLGKQLKKGEGWDQARANFQALVDAKDKTTGRAIVFGVSGNTMNHNFATNSAGRGMDHDRYLSENHLSYYISFHATPDIKTYMTQNKSYDSSLQPLRALFEILTNPFTGKPVQQEYTRVPMSAAAAMAHELGHAIEILQTGYSFDGATEQTNGGLRGENIYHKSMGEPTRDLYQE